MSLIDPAALLFGLLAIPIVLLYMLRMRRKEQPVPSVLLWSMLLRDRRADTPWQKLRRNLLLLLQLLILASLVLAMARPALPVASVAGKSLIVLLDASASMQAVDVSPSRFEQARQAVVGLIADLPADTSMSIVLVGDEPQVLASTSSDRAQLRASLAAAGGTGTADWPSALALAAGVAAQAREGTTVVIVSDGGLHGLTLPALPAEIRYLPVGAREDNLAISAMAVERTAAGTELFLQLHNYGGSERQVVVSLEVDGVLQRAEQVVVAGDASQDWTLAGLPDQGRVYRARLEHIDSAAGAPPDALALDDVAYAVLRPARERRALLFPYQSEPPRHNAFVERALLALDELTSFRAVTSEGGQITPPDEPFALYIVDGLWPGELPPGGLLMINPPENPLFRVEGVRAVNGPARVAEHPLTRFIDWEGVRVAEAKVTEPPPGSHILVVAGDLPLVFISEMQGRRLAVVAFDLHRSDLPLHIAFPILFAELVHYLAPAQAVDDAGLRPGQPVRFNLGPEVTQVTVTSPSGQVQRLESSAAGFVFTGTQELGLYQLEYSEMGTETQDQFAINLFDPKESSIRPADELPVAGGRISGTPADQIGQRELWPWLILAALLILLLEWWVDHRRPIRWKPGPRPPGHAWGALQRAFVWRRSAESERLPPST